MHHAIKLFVCSLAGISASTRSFVEAQTQLILSFLLSSKASQAALAALGPQACRAAVSAWATCW